MSWFPKPPVIADDREQSAEKLKQENQALWLSLLALLIVIFLT